MPLLSTFGAASARAFGNLSGIILPSDSLWNTVSFLSHFDGTNNGVNNVFDDGSASNHTITAVGNVTQGSFGPFARPDGEWSAALDGTGDYLSVADSADFNFTSAYTVEGWINCTSPGFGYLLCQLQDNDNSVSCIALIIDSANLNIILQQVVSGSFESAAGGEGSSGFSLNTWHHIAGTWDGSNMRLFVDGVLKATTATSNAPNNGSCPFTIGCRTADGGSGGDNFITGHISNARVVKNVAVYTSAFTPSTSPLTAISGTVLLTAQSNRFVDNSASAHTITPVADASVSAFGPFLTSEVYKPAVNGASAYFDGNGDYLKNTNNNTDLQFGTGDLTVEFWLYLNQIGVVQYPFDTRQSPNGDGGGIQVAILANNTMWVDMDGAGITLQTSLTLKANEWTHVALTRASGTWRFFFNGVLNSGTASNSGNITGGYLSVGTSATRNTADTDDKIKGYMSDVRAVKGTAVYTSAFTPPTAPLTAITNTTLLLNMADGQAIDSAAQNNLTLADDVKLSTAKAKFGDTSMLFDGSGKAYIESSNVVNFGLGDFTVEFFMNITTGGAEEVVFDARNPSQGAYFDLELDTSNRLNYYVLNGIRITSSALSTNTWYHVAVCRSGTSTKMFIDGTQAGNTYSDSTVYLSTNRVVLGGYSNSATYDFDGYLDEIRVSKTARYTSNFTAPSEPFADKGQ